MKTINKIDLYLKENFSSEDRYDIDKQFHERDEGEIDFELDEILDELNGIIKTANKMQKIKLIKHLKVIINRFY